MMKNQNKKNKKKMFKLKVVKNLEVNLVLEVGKMISLEIVALNVNLIIKETEKEVLFFILLGTYTVLINYCDNKNMSERSIF